MTIDKDEIQSSDIQHLLSFYKQYVPKNNFIFYQYIFSEISAETFLIYAKRDISHKGRTGSKRGHINALTNVKRSISQRIDNILFNWKLIGLAKKKRWNFPTKIELLNNLGVKIPNVLKNQITEKRNELEHEYRFLSNDDRYIHDVIEITEMFLNISNNDYSHGTILLSLVSERQCRRKNWPDGMIVYNDEKEVVYFMDDKQLYKCKYSKINLENWKNIHDFYRHNIGIGVYGFYGDFILFQDFPFLEDFIPHDDKPAYTWERFLWNR